MVALIEGIEAPDFVPKSLQGKQYSESGALEKSPPVLITIFNIYIKRIAERAEPASVLAVCQDFDESLGVSPILPILPDEKLVVTEAYEPNHEPSLFLVNREYTIETSLVGFDRDGLTTVAKKFDQVAKNEKLPG